jgi:hypothetical protein
MKRLVRQCLAVTAAMAAFAGATPAHAEGNWQLTNTTYTTVHVSLPHGALDLLAAPGTCVPTTRRVDHYGGRENTWVELNTGQIEFEYIRTASGLASADCATGARVTVQVSEYAPYGEPAIERGDPVTETSTTPQSGYYRATATAQVRVLHYDPRVPYVRGPALLEAKAKGWYKDRANKWIFMGCVVVTQSVTPTPRGPVMGDPTTSPCAEAI